MAKVTVTVNASTMASEETFSGEPCKTCGDGIYGIGFRIVIAMTVNTKDTPTFKETDVILCTACKTAVEW
jgi:hypothetical protein